MLVVDGNDRAHEISPYCFDCGSSEDNIEIVKVFNYAVLLRCIKCGNGWSKKLTEKNLMPEGHKGIGSTDSNNGVKQHGKSED